MRVRVTKRARAHIEQAATWWEKNRPLAPAAINENAEAIAQAIEWYERGLDFADALRLSFVRGAEAFAAFDIALLRLLRIASHVRQTDTSPTAFHRHDGALCQVQLVLSDDTHTDRRLLQVAKIDEPHDSSMGSAESDRELAEILVERYEYLAVLRCVGEDWSSPGSALQSPAHSTSCPACPSSFFAPGQMQLSSKSFRLPHR